MSDGTVLPDFYDPQLARAFGQLSPDEVHGLPFGCIHLDANGTVIFYSDAERRLSGYRKDVVVCRFFTDIAPCMNNATFKGRIDRALLVRNGDAVSGWIGAPTLPLVSSSARALRKHPTEKA
jgi:photoactive yellow protein